MSLLVKIQEVFKKRSKKPWLCVEMGGVGKDGRIEMKFSWNRALIENLNKAGFFGTNEEETIQLFILSSQMRPEDFPDPEEVVSSSAHPGLQSELLKAHITNVAHEIRV